MVWVIAFGELFFGDLWCVVWGYGGMRTHFSLLNPVLLCPADGRRDRRPRGNRGVADRTSLAPWGSYIL